MIDLGAQLVKYGVGFVFGNVLVEQAGLPIPAVPVMVVAGALATAHEDDFWARIKRGRGMRGQILGPFEAFLLIRGMRTLALRVPAACVTAHELAVRLSNHAAVAKVLVADRRTS